MKDAVAKVLGYMPDKSTIQRALDYYDGIEISHLNQLLNEKIRIFNSDRHYGVNLADAIDELKIAIAVYHWKETYETI
jgi:hypothetical protein